MKTYGYDYAFAITADAVTAILARNLAHVSQTVHFVTVDQDSGSTITLDATLAPWRMADGGGGALLNVWLPISEGSLAVEGGAIVGSYDLSGVSTKMQITLGWVGAGDKQAATGSGDMTHLTFDPTPGQDPSGQGYVATLYVDDPNGNLDDIASGLLKDIMAGALYDNRKTVAYVFANVSPAPLGLATWLAPGEWQYFVTGKPNLLSFLCMLSGSATFPAQPSFDTTALRPGSNSAILVSQGAFFTHVALPAVKAAFPSGTFNVTVSPTGDASIANSGGFDVKTVSASAYSLTANGAGTGLTASASGGGPLKFLFGLADLPNASYSWSIVTQNPGTFDGTTLRFSDDPSPVTHQDHTMPWYDWILVVVLGITDVAGLVDLIQNLVNNFGDQAQNVGIGTINTNLEAATAGALVNVNRVVDWTRDGQTLPTTAAGMDEAVFVAGNLAIPAP